jgi:hypothetical protein
VVLLDLTPAAAVLRDDWDVGKLRPKVFGRGTFPFLNNMSYGSSCWATRCPIDALVVLTFAAGGNSSRATH